jgi:iron complex outermembrane receptor protein
LDEIEDEGDESVFFYRRMLELGNRIYNNFAHTFKMVVGLTGEITENYLWEIYLNYGKNQNLNYFQNTVNLSRMFETADPELCAMNANKGCIVGDYFGPGDLQPEVADYIRLNAKGYTEWNMIDSGLLLKGRLFDLQGGKVGAVIGFQAGWEAGGNYPDSTVEAGEGADNATGVTQGDYSSQELFGELSFPILKDLPAFHSWTIDLAGRFSHFETFGNKFTYRVGTTWAPLPDFSMRGAYSTAFRAPTIGELWGGEAVSYRNISDPCNSWGRHWLGPEAQNAVENCTADGVPEGYLQKGSEVRTKDGSNPSLEAETSKNWTVGLILEPTFLPERLHLRATFDYWDTKVGNAVHAISPQHILDNCYYSDPADFADNEFCTLVERRPDGQIQIINSMIMNLGEIHTNGFDWTVNLGFPIYKQVLKGSVGWQNSWLKTYTERFKGERIDPWVEDSFMPDNMAGTIDYERASLSHWRWSGNFDIGGTWWTISNRVRFIQGAKIWGTDYTYPTLEVPDVAYWDLAAGINWKGLDFVVGLDNVLDREPPFVPMVSSGANTNIATYDAMGRYVYARIGYQFL